MTDGTNEPPCNGPERRVNDWPDWVTPAMVLAASLWIVREVRAVGERLAHLEGRILGWQDRSAGPPPAA